MGGGGDELAAGDTVILLPQSVRVYVATAPMNLRKSFEGLSNEVRTTLAADPLSGHVFLFLNRTRTMVKMLLWTRGGFTIVHKRLERGRFTFPARVVPEATQVEIGTHELAMLLEGLAATSSRAAARWNPPLRGSEIASKSAAQ
jgi:transposase